jgi:hypothetical protein
MTTYQVSGNVREQLGVEQAAEISNLNTDAVTVVAANIDAINKVAASLGSFENLPAVVAAAAAFAQSAQNAQIGAETAEDNANAAAAGIDQKVQLADDWARKMGAPVDPATGDVSAEQSATNAGGSADDAAGAADSAATYATQAAGAAVTVDQIVNGPSGTEVPAGSGHFTLATYLDQIADIVAQAPVLSGRFVNDAGISGEETINLAASDFYHTIEVKRAAGHDVKLKCLQGLYTGPPPQGQARSYAWVHVLNSGAGAVHVEGPSDPGGGTITTVYPPKRIAYVDTSFRINTPGVATPTVNALAALPVPAGTSRFATIVCMSSYWSGTGHSTTLACPNITGLTKQQTAGDGTIGNADPILIDTWTGTIDDAKGSLTDLGITATSSGFLARLVVVVLVHQDCSGSENPFAIKRSGNVATITRNITPSVAQAVNVLVAGFQKNISAPVGIVGIPAVANAEDFTDNGVGVPNTGNNDTAYGVLNDAGLSAVAYAYTATGAQSVPAVFGGVTLKPRTVTTVTPVGDDGLVTDQTKPFLIAPKQQGFVMCASDGSTWYADK